MQIVPKTSPKRLEITKVSFNIDDLPPPTEEEEEEGNSPNNQKVILALVLGVTAIALKIGYNKRQNKVEKPKKSPR